MEGQSKEEYIGSLRRKSSGFSRGVSKYRGVARHHHNGRWEARIGRVFGNKYLYLGTYATQEEAATAYDMAAIEYRGLNAVTNFDLSRYIKCLRPSPGVPNGPDAGGGAGTEAAETAAGGGPAHLHHPQGGDSASSALSLLLQSSKFKEMLERTSSAEEDRGAGSTTSSESEAPRRSFPDDIQTYFDCHHDASGGLGEYDGIFGDLSSFVSPIFHCELDV
ncbi:hypothetical protein BT93_F2188 [Corymbia citriodora subsp. variegata]|nr:hypothetical protein BT93_F2188 [Corymbia citriodora subsp. variegata]